ncbi:MAG: phosphotransferase family protein [Xanthomonadales bacterium]|nr:phosphotransferase family protein [Xanthomonadales bacterium]
MTLQPEIILDGWREWEATPAGRPVIIRELGGGRSNRSLLLKAANAQMVLRINVTASALPSHGRKAEADIWRAASGAGIAPRLLHADPAGRFLVSAYIENNLPDRPQDDPALAIQALDLLQRCHRLEVDAPAMNYASHIERYWRFIESRRTPVSPALLDQRRPMQDLLAALGGGETGLSLCHHDPVVANFVGGSGRLYLLDWEYAAIGWPVMDFAALGCEWEIADDVILERTGVDSVSLSRASTLYRYLCALWETVNRTR